MNPSYNGSFGSGYPGGQVPGGVNSGSFGGVPQGQPMSMGTGDIVLSSDNGGQRSSKKWVAVIVVAILAILIGIGFWFLSTGSVAQNPQKNEDLQQKYNSYVNYVLSGKEDDSEPERDFIVDLETSYFGYIDEDEINEYLQKAEEKYTSFENGYYQNNAKNEISLTPLKAFFQDYVKIKTALGKFNTVYKENGKDSAEKLITENTTQSDTDDEVLAEYKAKRKESLEAYLQLWESFKDEKCFTKETGIAQSCFSRVDGLQKTYDQKIEEANEAFEKMNDRAMETLVNLYDLFYPGSSSNSAQNEGNKE